MITSASDATTWCAPAARRSASTPGRSGTATTTMPAATAALTPTGESSNAIASEGETPSARQASRYASGNGFARPRSAPDVTTENASSSPTRSSAQAHQGRRSAGRHAEAHPALKAPDQRLGARLQHRPAVVMGPHQLQKLDPRASAGSSPPSRVA